MHTHLLEGFPGGSGMKNPPVMQETLGWENPLQKKKGTYSRILAWEIPRTEEPRGLRSMGSERVRPDWATEHTHMLWLLLFWRSQHDQEWNISKLNMAIPLFPLLRGRRMLSGMEGPPGYKGWDLGGTSWVNPFPDWGPWATTAENTRCPYCSCWACSRAPQERLRSEKPVHTPTAAPSVQPEKAGTATESQHGPR